MLRFPVAISHKRNQMCLNKHTVFKLLVGDSLKSSAEKKFLLINEDPNNQAKFWIEADKECSLIKENSFKNISCIKRKKFKFKVFKGYPSKLTVRQETICKKYTFTDEECKCFLSINFIVAKLEANRYLRDYKVWEEKLGMLVN